jgi:PhnB protein
VIENGIPEGYPALVPIIRLPDVAPVITFMEQVLGAKVKERYEGPDGGVMHAEVVVGDSVVMLGDAPDGESMPASMMVWLPDVDAAYRRAIDAGATSLAEPADQFYGARVARLMDSAGNVWGLGTQTEEVSEEELRRRMSKGQG